MNSSLVNQQSLHRASYRMQHLMAENDRKTPTQSWLIVYLDIITLLLAMFILMVNQPQEEFLSEQQKISQTRLQPNRVEAPVIDKTEQDSNQRAESESETPDKNQNVQQEMLKKLEALRQDNLEIEIEPGTITLRLPEAILFDTGRSQLLGGADQLLEKIAPVIKQYDYPVSVEGHTDNVPVKGGRFPSNWELSSARASTVIRKLIELGIGDNRLQAIGYADTRPIDSNDSPQGRSNNRRVNITIHATSE